MSTVRRLLATLGLKVDERGFKRADKAIDSTKSKMESLPPRDAKGRFMKVAGAAENLAGKLDGLKTAAGAALGVLAGLGGAEIATSFFEANQEFEKLQASLVTVEKSANKAQAAFQRIEKFAARTPYSLSQVTEAYIKLKALGLDPSERALESYGNTASAMGKDLMDMIEAVADASTGEFERLKEFGIKSSKQGDKVKFTFQGVTKEIKNDSKAIQEYLLGIGETAFAGGMERQAQTLGGVLSTAKDNVAGFFREVGKAGANDALRELLKGFSVGAGDGKQFAQTLGRNLAKGLRAFGSAVQWVADNFKALSASLAFGAVVAGVAKLLAAWKAVGGIVGVFGMLKAAVLPLLPIFFKLLLPVAALVAAITAVGLVIDDLRVYFNGGESAIGRFLDRFKNSKGVLGTLARALSSFLPKLKELGGVLVTLAKEGLTALQPIFDQFSAFGRQIKETVVAAFKDLGKAILGDTADGISTLTAAMDGIIAGVKIVFPLLVAFVGQQLQALLLVFKLTFAAAGLAIRVVWNVVQTVFSAIRAFMQPILAGFASGFAATFTKMRVVLLIFQRVFQAIWAAIKPYVSPVLEWMQGAVQTAADAISSAFESVQSAVAPVFSWLGEQVTKLQTQVFEKIGALLDKLAGFGKQIAAAVGVDMGKLESDINAIKGATAPAPSSSAASTPVGPAQTAAGAKAGGGTTTQTNTSTVGTVQVNINGSTNMGAGEVGGAVRGGVGGALQSQVNEMGRNLAGAGA